jgi:hypothetical protein
MEAQCAAVRKLIPASFAQGIHNESRGAGAAWLDLLPSTIAQVLNTWRLTPDGNAMHGYLAIVIPGETKTSAGTSSSSHSPETCSPRKRQHSVLGAGLARSSCIELISSQGHFCWSVSTVSRPSAQSESRTQSTLRRHC